MQARLTPAEYKARAKERKAKRAAKRREIFGQKASKATLKAQVKKLLSTYVILRDKRINGGLCLICTTKQKMGILNRAPNPIQLAYHIFPASSGNAANWNEENICGGCCPCNFGEKNHRLKYQIIHENLVGRQKYEYLRDLSMMKKPMTTADFMMKRNDLQRMIEDVLLMQ